MALCAGVENPQHRLEHSTCRLAFLHGEVLLFALHGEVLVNGEVGRVAGAKPSSSAKKELGARVVYALTDSPSSPSTTIHPRRESPHTPFGSGQSGVCPILLA